MNEHFRCNICGKELDLFDKQENFSIHKTIGYGSEHDGEKLDLHICCDCMDAIINGCQISPINNN